ncbi:MATE family efflux transporter [Paraburkholderia acidicola]|uniref:Multidrug-efflux transporter n=1 Tax=Paraburkholderia acidicola TaxID=1912599 RepID=A0A2A4F446_9BURK|nr:MATE family efflux transporter [Paraburkholderia acidicola]PCE28613.1 MATE family efflux transporter [Paraburkholderia acidicola]
MKDLTQGSITRHIVAMAVPIGVGMVFQSMYYLVDLYFVGRLGADALAGVGAAGNVSFLVMALTQVLGAGTVALMAQAAGRKNQEQVGRIFNQALVLAITSCLVMMLLGYVLTGTYMRSTSATPGVVEQGRIYLYWFMPGMALQFVLTTMGSGLRGIGIVKPTMVVQLMTVALNIVLAPVLIVGWGTGHAMGVAGAGLASTLSLAAAAPALAWHIHKLGQHVQIKRSLLKPRLDDWWRILSIGLPAGGEYALLFLYSAATYWAIRDFGPAAQAGFGAGARLMQVLILPVLALSFAVGPMVGQNVGAGMPERVRQTLVSTIGLISAITVLLCLLLQWGGESLIGGFAKDNDVVAQGTQYLRIASWNFIAQGVIYTCSSVFQGLGNTRPALLSSAVRLLSFVLPVAWLSARGDFHIVEVWYLSVASMFLQAVFSLWLVRREFRLKLTPALGVPSV